MAQQANKDPSDGELDFSDGELSEMGADVAGREGGQPRRKRPTLRVPADEVRRPEDDAPKAAITTEPSLAAFVPEPADEVVEMAFTPAATADGEVPCVRDLAEAVHN